MDMSKIGLHLKVKVLHMILGHFEHDYFKGAPVGSRVQTSY